MKVKITNYQILKDIELNFVKGINAIVGSTNNGKSSIIRAIKGAINNQGGSGFIKYNADETQVNITHNSDSVIWTKSKKQGKSNYNINGEIYNKIGQTQLLEVADIFNMPEINVGNERFQINFWNQLDKPFLVDKTAYQLFDFISKSKEQEQVDTIKQESDKQVQTYKKSVEYNYMLIDRYNKELINKDIITKNLKNLDKFNTKTLEEAVNVLTKTINSLSIINNLNSTIKSIEINLTTINENLNKLYELYTKADKLLKDYSSTEELFMELELLDHTIYSCSRVLDTSKLSFYISIKNKLEIKFNELEELTNLLDVIIELLNEYKAIDVNIKTNNKEIKDLNNQIKLLNKELDSYKVCPLCNSSLAGGKHGQCS